MELLEIYGKNSLNNKLNISFEVFPPKDGDISKLFEELRCLKKYNPALISLTFGANATGARFSIEDLRSLQNLDLNLMPHFTCISYGKTDILKYIIRIENLGIENILALRGDIPNGLDLSELDFHYASELVEYIKEKTTLSIGVAGYPEGHIEAKTFNDDILNLKRKINAGGEVIFTQLFFDNTKFYSYMDTLSGNNINSPVVAGIMPVRSITQLDKMTTMARVTIPDKLRNDLEKYPNDSKKIGTEFCISQCRDLIDNGINSLHFFTLNHSDMVSEILDNIL